MTIKVMIVIRVRQQEEEAEDCSKVYQRERRAERASVSLHRTTPKLNSVSQFKLLVSVKYGDLCS